MQSKKSQSNLPPNWSWVKLGDVADYINGRAFKPSEWEDKGCPIIRIQNLNNEYASYNYTTKNFEDKYLVKKGDLLFAWSASLGTYIWNESNAWLNQHIFKVIPKEIVNKKFLFYSIKLIVNHLYSITHGSGMVHVTKRKFEESEIPLPPLPEQKKIVDKIEELFSGLDSGVASLKKAKEQIKLYRQSVLAYAFSGRLTNSPRIEPIRTDQSDQSNQRAILPEGWKWVKLGEFVESMKNGIYKPASFYSEDGIACLRMYNIQNGKIVWINIKRMNISKEEVKEYELIEGDILVNRVNSRELVGKSALIKKGLEKCIYESKNIRLRLKSKLNSVYINYWLLLYANQFFNRNAQQTVGMASINQPQLASMPFPYAPINQQQQIVEEIEKCFSEADNLEKAVDESLTNAETLRQSILKRAFEGKLL